MTFKLVFLLQKNWALNFTFYKICFCTVSSYPKVSNYRLYWKNASFLSGIRYLGYLPCLLQMVSLILIWFDMICLLWLSIMYMYDNKYINIKNSQTNEQSHPDWGFKNKCGTGGPRYSRTFYLQIRLLTFENRSKMIIFQSKIDLLSANSWFTVQNDGTYLPRIMRETCTINAIIISQKKESIKLLTFSLHFTL